MPVAALIFLVTFVAVVIGATVLPPLFMLHRESASAARINAAAGLAFAAGAIPGVCIFLFRYMVVRDYYWAIRGPAPFSQLGSGPWWLWTFVFGVIATGLLWGLGFWLLVYARHAETPDEPIDSRDRVPDREPIGPDRAGPRSS